jgi:hypothetical protein
MARRTGLNEADGAGAMEALILVVDNNGPTMFARIGVMRALNRNVARRAAGSV